MSHTFTKLFSSITASTIWCEDSDIRVVWITMLAMCDKNGRVFASIPGLAKYASVPIENAEKALKKFMSPDPYSRTKDHEGRRIEEIEGGWRLLNHGKYRAIRNEEERRAYKTEKQREYRNKNKNVDNVDRSGPQKTHTDAYTYTDPSKTLMSGKPDELEILNFLNEKTGRNYQPVKSNLSMISARLKEYSKTQLRQVIAKKCREWGTDEKMEPYLRPATLFNATKCAQYVGELGQQEVERG